MPRINRVQRSRSARQCSACGGAIAKGEPYIWVKSRYGPRRERCVKPECQFRQSELTSSEKLSQFYGAQENIEDAVDAFRKCDGKDAFSDALKCLIGEIESARDEITEVSEQYEESAQNMDEYFPGSSQVDEIREKAENAQTVVDEIDTALDQIHDREIGDDEEFDDVVEEVVGEIENIDFSVM